MNVNLGLAVTDSGDTVHAEVEEHKDLLTGAGFALTGRVALVMEDAERYPGSYRVVCERVNDQGWAYVDPDGQVHTRVDPLR